jgi:hypothetical protein
LIASFAVVLHWTGGAAFKLSAFFEKQATSLAQYPSRVIEIPANDYQSVFPFMLFVGHNRS